MKLKVELTQAEKRTLQQLSRKHFYQDFRTRGLGLLLLGDGRRPCDIAEELEVSARSLYNWAHAWQDKGLCGLLVGHKGGRPRALSDAMIATAVAAARSESMTLKQIAQYIEAVHGEPLPCRLETLSVALKHAGFSYKRGWYSLKKRDEQEFAMKAEVLTKLQQAVCDDMQRLVYFDAAGISASPPVQRGWSPIGEPHRIIPQPHCKRAVLGALDFAANQLRHQSYKESIKRPTVVQFLDQTAQQSDPSKMTVVVLDNAKIHHNIDQETIDRWLVDHRMVLFYLPTYSPELNLIEIVWKHAKYHWRRFTTWTKETIDAEIEQLLGAYGSKFEIRFS